MGVQRLVVDPAVSGCDATRVRLPRWAICRFFWMSGRSAVSSSEGARWRRTKPTAFLPLVRRFR